MNSVLAACGPLVIALAACSPSATHAVADGPLGQDAPASHDAPLVHDASGDDAAARDAQVAYAGHLVHVLCDVKRPLAGMDATIDSANYAAILDGFVTALHCDGVRVYVDPTISDPTQYPAIYQTFFAAARARGLVIYANPLATGSFGLTPSQLGMLAATYANHFQPEMIGPLNESGLDGSDAIIAAQATRAGLTYAATIIGPDVQHVSGTQKQLATPGLGSAFDVLGSHDAVSDDSATTAGWNALASATPRAVWATEDPRPLHATNGSGDEVGVAAVIAAQVAGLVLYEAYPSLVDATGTATTQGAAIGAALVAP